MVGENDKIIEIKKKLKRRFITTAWLAEDYKNNETRVPNGNLDLYKKRSVRSI